MTLIEDAVNRARIEYARNGVLSTTTVMKLSNLGVDVEALEEQFANN